MGRGAAFSATSTTPSGSGGRRPPRDGSGTRSPAWLSPAWLSPGVALWRIKTVTWGAAWLSL